LARELPRNRGQVAQPISLIERGKPKERAAAIREIPRLLKASANSPTAPSPRVSSTNSSNSPRTPIDGP
jgi:hypothetical protein